MTSRRILVADDNPAALDQTRHVLETNGYEVLTCDDGVAAINTAVQALPDAVLLDVIMPGKNGFQVCRELRLNDATKGIPIVMFSSSSNESGRFWGLGQGASDYLTRPFEDSDLLDCLERVLDATVCARAVGTTDESDSDSGTLTDEPTDETIASDS